MASFLKRVIKLFKYTIKQMLIHNPIDAFANWFRKKLAKRGLLERFDHWVYFSIGYRFFPKLLRFTNKTIIKGVSRIPKKGPLILVANYRYDLDPFYVSTFLPREMHWVSKYENFTTPIMRTIIAPFGPIPLHRNRNDQTAVYMIRNLLHKNQIVGTFPEGHRSKTGKLSEFHAGAARYCLELKIPYVPVALVGKTTLSFSATS